MQVSFRITDKELAKEVERQAIKEQRAIGNLARFALLAYVAEMRKVDRQTDAKT